MKSDKLKSFKDFVGVNARQDIINLIRNVSSGHYENIPSKPHHRGLRAHHGYANYLALTTSPWVSENTIRIYNIPHFVDDGPLSRYIQPLIDTLNDAGYTIANWRYEYDETTPQAKADLEAGYVDIIFKHPKFIKGINENKLQVLKQFRDSHSFEILGAGGKPFPYAYKISTARANSADDILFVRWSDLKKALGEPTVKTQFKLDAYVLRDYPVKDPKDKFGINREYYMLFKDGMLLHLIYKPTYPKDEENNHQMPLFIQFVEYNFPYGYIRREDVQQDYIKRLLYIIPQAKSAAGHEA